MNEQRRSAGRRDPVTPIKTTEALGQCEAFLEFQERLSRVAPIDRPVLLIGERGTGKELAAFRLHFLSRRWQGPLVALNCSTLVPSLIESELFGYEKGAFTGALQRRTGRFEAADGGTLFLDEIGTIPLEVQGKILRVVEYGVFERVGSWESVEVDVRIVAATNEELPELVKKNQFKADLIDRLSFEVLLLPPLRERKDDIVLLAEHFAARMAFELGREEIPQFSDEVKEALLRYSWPGNIRELKNVVERATYRSESARITEIVFDPFRPPGSGERWRKAEAQGPCEESSSVQPVVEKSFHDAVRDLEVRLLEEALHRAKYNQKRAARILGLSYHQFRGLYRKYRQGKRSRE